MPFNGESQHSMEGVAAKANKLEQDEPTGHVMWRENRTSRGRTNCFPDEPDIDIDFSFSSFLVSQNNLWVGAATRISTKNMTP